MDGFRFDLASCLCRDEHGTPLEAPPLIRDIAKDPVLSKVCYPAPVSCALGYGASPADAMQQDQPAQGHASSHCACFGMSTHSWWRVACRSSSWQSHGTVEACIRWDAFPIGTSGASGTASSETISGALPWHFTGCMQLHLPCINGPSCGSDHQRGSSFIELLYTCHHNFP